MDRRVPVALVLVAVAALVSGCTASGDGASDPWAYTKKPLYAGGFDLAKVNGTTDTQQFRVSDGSIGAIRLLVWVNATSGGATVVVRDPAGQVVLTASETTETQSGLNLGTWTVAVTGAPGATGIVHVLAVRG